jgi:hypothetical protein
MHNSCRTGRQVSRGGPGPSPPARWSGSSGRRRGPRRTRPRWCGRARALRRTDATRRRWRATRHCDRVHRFGSVDHEQVSDDKPNERPDVRWRHVTDGAPQRAPSRRWNVVMSCVGFMSESIIAGRYTDSEQCFAQQPLGNGVAEGLVGEQIGDTTSISRSRKPGFHVSPIWMSPASNPSLPHSGMTPPLLR